MSWNIASTGKGSNLSYSQAGTPSLDLRFSETKTLRDFVSGRDLVTFTRSSPATYVDSAGVLRTAGTNEPRFDHNPTTGESLGLLVEEQRTNLLRRSEEFDDASWAKLNGLTVAANAIAAPNGEITADKIVEPASSADKPVVQLVTLVASTTYTASLYIKAAERPAILFHVRKSDYSTRFGGFFNTSTNTFTAEVVGGGVLDSFTFSNVGGGWYLCSITGNIGANTAGVVTIYIANSSNSLTYTGDGTSGIYIWGAQLEAGAFPTSYIPTTSSAATRNADIASITGTNFSRWFNPIRGTVFADTKVAGVAVQRYNRLWVITNSNLNREGISIFVAGGQVEDLPILIGAYVSSITVTNGAIEQIDANPIESALTTPRLKSAFAFEEDNCASSYNGQERFIDNSVNLSSFTTPLDRLLIGQPQRFQGHSCMTITRLTYWPIRLPNATLQALTQ